MQCDHGNGVRELSEVSEQQELELRSHEQENKQLKIKGLYGNIILMKHSAGDDVHQVTTNKNQIHARPILMSHMDHMEASKLGFFTINDLYVGKTMSIEFPTKDPSSLPHSLPREEADSMPFSMKEFPKLLQLFSISQDSHQAKIIENTLKAL